jgi:Protein of unknown function (DUF998)
LSGVPVLTGSSAAGQPGGNPARILLGIAGLSCIGIAACPESVQGSSPQHVAWTSLGAVVLAVWPASVARRTPSQPVILGAGACAAVTAVFFLMLGWLSLQTQGGSDLGLAERLTISIQTCWPFVVARALWHAGPAVQEAQVRKTTARSG